MSEERRRRTVLAKCSGGERAISGGFTSNLGGSARLAVSHRTSFSPTLGVFLDAWEVRLFNGGGSEGKFEVFVYCLEA